MDEKELDMRVEQLRRLEQQVKLARDLLEDEKCTHHISPLFDQLPPRCLRIGDFTIVDMNPYATTR